MPAQKLFQLLARPDVTELALQTGRPACALVNNAYRRVGTEPHRDEDIITLLAAAGGREHLAGLADGRSWEFHLQGVGTIRVSAAYEDALLRASLRLIARAQPELKRPVSVEPALSAPRVATAAAPAVPQRRAAPPAAKPVPEPAPASARTRPADPAPSARRAVPAAQGPAFAAPELPEALSRRERAPVAPLTREAPPTPPSAAADAPDPRARTLLAPAPSTEASFDTSGEVIATVSAEVDTLPTPTVHVVTSHDGFNFQPAGWAPSTPPPPPAARAEPRKPIARKFAGDALDDLLGQARERRASDVHILADRPSMLRVAGDLVACGEPLSAQATEDLLAPRVPPALRAQLDEHGSCDFSLIHPAYGRFRANVSRQRTGWKLTARPIGESIPTLAELGLPESIARATHHHQGLIVVTGSTGHGKTTTLAAIVGIINRETAHHVITVEDPIEYVHPTAKAVISQREVGTHTKSFQAALKGSLREDPDVIVVGELRDTETVRMALTASETGHLVISTMNTPSAAKAIERLIDLFPPGDQPQVRMTLAGGLRLIISQRLLPTADRSALCAAAEVLPGSLALWNLIRENRTFQISSLMQRGKSLGIVRLDESLAHLVKSGRTTLELAREVAEAPDQLEAMVLGRPIPMAGQSKPEAAGQPAATAAAQTPRAEGAAAATKAASAAAGKKGVELGKQVLSRAGKLFGG